MMVIPLGIRQETCRHEFIVTSGKFEKYYCSCKEYPTEVIHIIAVRSIQCARCFYMDTQTNESKIIYNVNDKEQSLKVSQRINDLEEFIKIGKIK